MWKMIFIRIWGYIVEPEELLIGNQESRGTKNKRRQTTATTEGNGWTLVCEFQRLTSSTTMAENFLVSVWRFPPWTLYGCLRGSGRGGADPVEHRDYCNAVALFTRLKLFS